MIRIRRVAWVLTGLLLLAYAALVCPCALAQAPVTITLSPNSPGVTIPPDFSGLSYENFSLFPDATSGAYYFRGSNAPLLSVFKTLGIHSVRFGGNTSELSNYPIPANSDLDSMFGFAQTAGLKVIYTLRLETFNPQSAASLASYAMGKYGSSISCFSIGSEPNQYLSSYVTYKSDVDQYLAAVTAAGQAPTAKFCGPGVSTGVNSWVLSFANDYAASGLITFISEHAYYGGNGGAFTAQAGRDAMLSSGFDGDYNGTYSALFPTLKTDGMVFRLEETNNFIHGCPGASDSFASALWGLDYLSWWAAHGAAGINFHTGDKTASHGTLITPSYTAFTTSPTGYSMHPLAYGIKSFDLAGHGRVVPVSITNPTRVNLTAYGSLANDGSLYVTIINKSHDTSATIANITLNPGTGFSQGSMWLLQAPNNDVSVTSGVTLGGAPINDDGTWSGTSSPVPFSGSQIILALPSASAAILQLRPTSTTRDFTLFPTPPSQSINNGASTSYTVTVNGLNGFTDTVNLSVSGLPSGATGSFSIPSIAGGSGSSTLLVNTDSTTAAGNYTITIGGTNGTLSHSTPVILVITVPQAAVPVLSPAGGNYTSTQTVTLSDTTPSSSIYYTTNGNAPNPLSSPQYTVPITVASTTTLKALAAAKGLANSNVASATYTIGRIPIRYEVEILPAVSSGPTHRVLAWSGFTDGVGTILDAAKIGDSVTYTLNVAQTGIYDVKVGLKDTAARGIWQLSLKGVNAGLPVDEYNLNTVFKEVDLGNMVIHAVGSQAFAFTVVGQNAKSTGFAISFDYIKLTPQ